MGEMWLPQLARQLATIDQMAGGRLTINIISSDMPGEELASAPRYQRTREWMAGLRTLLNGERLDADGEFVRLHVDPPRARTVSRHAARRCTSVGSPTTPRTSPPRRPTCSSTWPDTVASVATHGRRDARAGGGVRARAGLRPAGPRDRPRHRGRGQGGGAAAGVQARRRHAARPIRGKSLDAASVGVQRQAALREAATDDGFVEEALWTGVGRARSGAGAAIVGDPDQVVAKLRAYEDAGISAFILSGYTHQAECERFGRPCPPRLDHAR